MLAPAILNLPNVKDEIETLVVALQKIKEVTGSNANKFLKQNIGSNVEIHFVDSSSFCDNDAFAIHQSKDGIG